VKRLQPATVARVISAAVSISCLTSFIHLHADVVIVNAYDVLLERLALRGLEVSGNIGKGIAVNVDSSCCCEVPIVLSLSCSTAARLRPRYTAKHPPHSCLANALQNTRRIVRDCNCCTLDNARLRQ
jgi:hypothetical protein